MIVTRNPALEEILLARLAASFDGPLPEYTCPPEELRGSEIHLSDLLSPRQSIFKRLMPEPTNTKEAQLWMYGRGFEVEFVRRSGIVPAVSRLYCYRGPLVLGGDSGVISWRPDFWEWPGVFTGPIELKWRRANLADDGAEATEYENYLSQLRGYAALGGGPDAKLIVNTPRQGQSAGDYYASTNPATRVYDVTFDPAELDVWRTELVRRAEIFAAAFAGRGTFRDAPLCADWMCGRPKKTKDAYCRECDKPLTGQWGEKHTGTKAGAGHTVTPPEWGYEARCAWYAFCRPQDVDSQRGAR